MGTKGEHAARYDIQEEASLDAGAVGAEQLKGATVHDRYGENIGTVTDVVTAEDGSIETLVIDVGGFMGLARHTVGVGARRLSVRRGDDDEVRVVLTMTNDELRELPEHGASGIPPAAGYRT